MRLMEDDRQIFEGYLRCMYMSDPPHADNCNGMTAQLAGPYVLADKLGDLRTINLLVDTLVTKTSGKGEMPGRHSIGKTRKRLPTNSPLRRLFVDYYDLELDGRSVH